MNLKTVLSFARHTGLVAALALSACDSGEKKAEDPKKAEIAADEKKADEKKAAGDAKAEDAKALGDAKAEDAKALGDAKAEDAKAEGDAKAEDTKAEGDAKAEDAKAAGDAKADAKAEPKKAEPKKADDKKGDSKAEDKTAKIDAKAIYDAKCKVCHAPDGKGAENQQKNNIPDMTAKDWQSKHSKAAVVKAIADGVDGTKMKAFKDKLTKDEIDALAAFVKKM